MEAHEQRVIEEQAQVSERLVKLGAFLGTAVFSTLPGAEKLRMRRQFMIMQLYEQVLVERIAAWVAEPGEKTGS